MYKHLTVQCSRKEDLDRIKQCADMRSRSLESRIEHLYSSESSSGFLRKSYHYELFYYIDDRVRDELSRLVFSLDSKNSKVQCREVREIVYSFHTSSINNLEFLENLKSELETIARKNRLIYLIKFDEWGRDYGYYNVGLKGNVKGDPRGVINFKKELDTKKRHSKEFQYPGYLNTALEFK